MQIRATYVGYAQGFSHRVFTMKNMRDRRCTICQPLDFYGLNFYNVLYDNADKQREISLR